MLAADKLQLQSALKQQATALKEKEFSLHHNNLMTVGTQAAVLAGLDITMFIEFSPPCPTLDETAANHPYQQHIFLATRVLTVVYYAVIVAAFCANMTVVSHTTALSVLGGGLALRGPDGSMMTATDVLYAERKSVFSTFAFGLACTVGSVLAVVWIMLSWEAALLCWIVALYTCRLIYQNFTRTQRLLDFDENDTVDFTDIFDGPAAIQALPTRVRYNKHYNDHGRGGTNRMQQKNNSSSYHGRKNAPTSLRSRSGGGSVSTGSQYDDSYYYDDSNGNEDDDGDLSDDFADDVEMQQRRGLLRQTPQRNDHTVNQRSRHRQKKKLESIQTV